MNMLVILALIGVLVIYSGFCVLVGAILEHRLRERHRQTEPKL